MAFVYISCFDSKKLSETKARPSRGKPRATAGVQLRFPRSDRFAKSALIEAHQHVQDSGLTLTYTLLSLLSLDTCILVP